MKYAIISSGNKQLKVAEGDIVVVDHLNAKANDGYDFAEVLLFVDGDTRKVGTPVVKEVVVSGKVLEEVKGPKVRIAKFKAKARYRKVMGFRASLTKVQIEKIALKK